MRCLYLALVLAPVGLTACARQAPPPADAGPPKVTVAAPLARDVTVFSEMTGSLAAVKNADVRARVSGYVEKILFTEGTEVPEGQELVRIDPQPFRVALNQSKANLASSQAQQTRAAANEARINRLQQSGSVSPDEVEQARAQSQVARAQVQASEAEVEQANLNLGYTTVRAPFAGRVDRVFVNEGNVVTGGSGQGTILTRVVAVDPIYAYFTVDEQSVLDYMRRMARTGQSAGAGPPRLPVEAQLRDETGYPHRGTIDFAGSELNPTTGSLQVRGVFPNPGPPRLLRPGLFVRGRIPMTTAVNALLIPEEAIVYDMAQRVVYVVGGDNRVASKPVTLGPRSEGLRVVEGLAPDDRVVIKGYARLQPGMPVDPQPGEVRPASPPAANPPGPGGDAGEGARPGAGGNAARDAGARGRPANAAGGPSVPKR